MSGNSKSSGSDQNKNTTIRFGEKYAESDKFSAIFQEGMGLVEDTAAYLDGDGRRDAGSLEPPISLAYATESMRLTTRLMQIASWLLIRRAVNEGELTPKQAFEEKNKVKLKAEQPGKPIDGFENLPERLRELITSSLNLNRRIMYLDKLLNAEHTDSENPQDDPLEDQRALLREAFGEARSGNAKDAG